MPSDLIQKRLSQLSELSGELEKANDSINHLLESFQKQLCALELDVPAYVDVKIPGAKLQIGYDRLQEWCLVYRSWVDEESTWGEERPLVMAERDVRIAALPLLPRLLGAVKDGSEKTLRAIHAAKARLMDELRKT